MASSFTRFLDHTHDAPQSEGLLWTSDRPVTETSTSQHTTLWTDILASVGFELTISAGGWPQTYAVESAATQTGFLCINTLPKSVSAFYRKPNTYTESLEVQGDTKKRELLKHPTKIEEIQEKKITDRN
jgi:hypothetical protein